MKEKYESPLSSRYASDTMLNLFSQETRIRTWRRLWAALARAEHELGLPVSAEQVAELEAHLEDIDFACASRREKEVRHDVMAHIYAYGQAAPSAAGIIHLGATSCYVTDNGDLILYREGLRHLRLELLGDNKVRLQISEEYAAFARENEIENFIDFHWMRNAFIIDYFAQLCLDKGYTDGYFVSWDGYTRNLSEGTDFSFNLFNRVDSTIFPAGTMVYNVPTAIVALRDYPMLQRDSVYYYTDSRGVISCHLDPEDGVNRCATTYLVCYSTTLGCADILMEMAPVYITAEFDEQALNGLAETGIQSIWFENFVIRHTQKDLRVVNVLNQEDHSYTIE